MEGCATAFAVRACPFLRSLAEREGDQFAASIARDATCPARRGSCGPLEPLLPEEGVYRQFGLFHGPQGVCPLSGFEARARDLAQRSGSCPDETVVPLAKATAPLPLASMGMSFGPGVSFSWALLLRSALGLRSRRAAMLSRASR